MAAYAALVSLSNIIEQLKNHPRLSIYLDKKQAESLHEKAGFLQDFLEGYSHGGSKEAEVLEREIASAAYAAEDVIESHVVNQIHAGSFGNGETSFRFLLDLRRVIEGMDYVKEKVMEFRERKGFKDQQPTYSTSATSAPPLTIAKNTMVGFDDELYQLMDKLTGGQPNREIIPIVGMGGIGKTILAKNAYENSLIVQHFDIRCWVTVSQEYSTRKILSDLLSSLKNQEKYDKLGATTGKMGKKTEAQLSEELHKMLSGRRYLVILDDIWSTEVWDKIKFFFPDIESGSRIVVTTRLSNVASYVSSSVLVLNFLDEEKSWKLFCEKAFLGEGCPVELEEIGKQIVEKCKGLPLSIVVTGGFLGKANRIREYWENVARDINSILKLDDNEHCLDILSLSYSHLPAHLKPCFLYLGIFPEDHEVRVSRLIKLWVAEGFVKRKESQSLEEVAEDYLKDLVDRNLILVRRLRWNGRIKYYAIHDFLRELCLRVTKKEKFLHMMKMHDIPYCLDRERRVVSHESILEYLSQVFPSTSLARSFIFKGGPFPFKFPLLRVLSEVNSDPLEAILQQVNLRYLLYKPFLVWNPMIPPQLPFNLHSSIFLLWNVQTLIIRGDTPRIAAPPEIWYMPQLRHLDFNEVFLPHPPQSDTLDRQDGIVLQNLQTLANVVNLCFCEEVCKRIPNIKKLHIRYDDFYGECYHLKTLSHLQELQSLNCSFYGAPERGDLLLNLKFPSSLQKLSLSNCFLHWEDVTAIGVSLPNLKVLKLGMRSVVGDKWDPVEEAFPQLKFLRICCEGLIYWTADSSHFPMLEKLVLDNLHRLEEVPLGIAEIPTLRYLRLYSCSESAAVSSAKILEEQADFGSEDLEVRVVFRSTMEEESFKKKVDIQKFKRKNFQCVVPFDFVSAMLAASVATEGFTEGREFFY